MMARAIELAKRGQYTTSPNPNVGCVIVDAQEAIIGEGWHQKAGSPHAEVNALEQTHLNGHSTHGCTAYVTLEPCSHHGKTPPCAEALIKAGIRRVVVAMEDPNPLVSGNGLAKLKSAGITTAHGLLQSAAEKLNRGFIKRMRIGKPWVTVKMAASLDGKTALKNGLSQWITNPQARQDVQRHRANSCAILSGSGTVLADNPSLNVRYGELNLTEEQLTVENVRQPLRVILDGRNQLPPDLTCLKSISDNTGGEVLLINSRPSEHRFAEHVHQWQAPYLNKQLDLEQVMFKLAEMQLNHIWVEAGAKLAGALLQNNLIDELILYQAPKLIGSEGQDLFSMNELKSMDNIINLSWSDIRQVGNDVKMTALFTHNTEN